MDIDECTTSSPCGGFAECYNTKGSFDCSCRKGYLPSTGKVFFHPKDGTVCTENPKKNCHLNSTCVSETINKTLELTFVNTVNNLVEKDELEVWNQLDQEDRKKSVTKLLHTVEQATLSISHNFQKNTQMEVNASDIALKLYTFESHQINHIHPHAYIDGDVIRIIPKQNKTVGSNGSIAIVFLRYDSIGFLLKPNYISEEMDDSLAKEPDDFTLNSQVIAGAINTIPPKIYQLDQVTFTLKHVRPVNQDVETKCAFWRYSIDNMKGHWSTEGCERTHFNTSHTGCKCNHLTHFAILMSSGQADVNLLAFGVIIYKVFRHTAVKKPEVSCYENIRSCARGALALLFLLGATWTFGVLHVVHDSAITAYLFTISNAFQGMFIFIFLCVLSRKVIVFLATYVE
ncbi:Adhesion G protein-coupled receptor L4 [Acipenser ruthenus]|uniref:Adhesion G protein-coupled receptor L4 n=1 Tax=Acipenser ruthenus TaxID=7906 RepID=A0A444U6G9_ACIRT|nr:Adhesion G protein-coupled receptor L4 [Acipenser ruthenus]